MNLLKTKKIILLVTIFVLIFNTFSFGATVPNTNSESVVLMDTKTGQILYQKNSNKKLYPASITKIMTSILAIEEFEGNFQKEITASQTAIDIKELDSSSIGTSAGEVLTVEQLLYALLLHSANECANILAEECEGSIQNFVVKMNEKAIELGAKNTNFNNTNGLTDTNHVTSAYDMALITQYALKNETFRQIVKTTTYKIPPTNMYKTERILNNKNKLINPQYPDLYYKNAIGVKTGYTSSSNHTFVGAAQKDGKELIVVCMNAEGINGVPQTYIDSINLLNYGFDNYSNQYIVKNTDVVNEVTVKKALKNQKLELSAEKDITVLLQNDTKPIYTYEDNIQENLTAPIKKGTIVGERTYTITSDNSTYKVNLIAANDIEAKNTNIIITILLFLLKLIFYILVIAVLMVIAMIVWIKLSHKKIKRKVNYHLTTKTNEDNLFDL